MQIKTQTKLTILLLFIVILFVIPLLIIHEIETNRTEMLFQDQATSKEIFFDKLVKLKSAVAVVVDVTWTLLPMILPEDL